MRIFLLCSLCLLFSSLGFSFEQKTDEQGFFIASKNYPFEFPRDHGAHDNFKTEWWYFTGNLESKDGPAFGYQLTVFRNQLFTEQSVTAPESSLALQELYLGHFGLSNISANEHREEQVLGRPSFGEADASRDLMYVQLKNWKITQNEDETIQLYADAENFSIDLQLRPQKPFVIHGENGIHLKTNNEYQASHYISYTRLESSGAIQWDDLEYEVSGLSWMDHEFGSSWLESEEAGWDWFAIQLDDGTDLMLYQIRRQDGTANPNAEGSLIEANGEKKSLPFTQYKMTPNREWKSPKSGATYPVEWTIEIPDYQSTLQILPAFDAQEMNTESSNVGAYWEGAIRITGTWNGKPANGKGYMELVGYEKAMEALKDAD